MPKNIEMSILNSEGSYDVLYPATMSNITYLTDAVSTLFDLAEGSSLDEALIRLLVGTDGYGYIITLKYPDGTPASGLTLSGITSVDGGNPVTDSNGWAFGKSNNTSVNIKMTGKNWLDVDFSNFQIQSTGTITNYNHVIPIREDDYILKVSSSKNYDENYLSPWIKTIDICGVGGGGGGGGAYRQRSGSTSASSAGGGGGGYVKNILGVNINSGDILKIQIGGSGSGGVSAYGGTNTAGGSGGTTFVSLLKKGNEKEQNLISAQGGNGGAAASHSFHAYNSGGSGNGNGGTGSSDDEKASDGTNGTGYIFNESSLGLAGGGGGGGSVNQSFYYRIGGLPYGGNGGVKSYMAGDSETFLDAKSGTGFGGGGGGAVNVETAPSGHAGGVYLRFHHT